MAPMSFAQQRLWFLDKLEPGTNQYTMCHATRLLGELDVLGLERALKSLRARHESLRTIFTEREGEPVQVVLLDAPWELLVTDLRSLSESERRIRCVERVEAAYGESFDLSRGPLFRAELIREGEAEQVLVLAMHHIVSDGWSIGVLRRELSALYNAYLAGEGDPLEELGIQYADFAVWQRDWLRGEELESQLVYWKEHLLGVPRLELPLDRPWPVRPSFAAGHHRFELDESLTAGLRELSRTGGVTLFTTLLSAFFVLLHRYSGQEDFAVGIPIAGRNRQDIEGLIGFFVNTLAIRNQIRKGKTFSQVLAEFGETMVESLTHQDLPFEKLVEELKPERSVNRNPLFDVMLAMDHVTNDYWELKGLATESLPIRTSVAKFGLSVDFLMQADTLAGHIEYRSELFDQESIVRMSRSFERLLAEILKNPDVAVDQVVLLHESDRRRIWDWNRTEKTFARCGGVQARIDEWATRQPQAIALLNGDCTMNYATLRRSTNRLAHALRERGVGRDTVVGVCMDRSPEMIVAVLAVLKAGGAYLPLDPTYPAAHLQTSLDDAVPPVLVLGPGAPQLRYQGVVFDFDASAAALDAYPDTDLPTPARDDALAYVMYTSGSTGRPKGVMIEHCNLSNYVLSANEHFAIGPEDRVLQAGAMSFDLSVEEIFCCLTHGATLVLRDPDTLSSARQFFGFCGAHRVTVAHLTTSYWHELVQDAAGSGTPMPAGLRLVVIGGEQAASDDFKLWRRMSGQTRLINSYGPTEGTVAATFSDLSHRHAQDDRRVPIGRPHANAQVHILDDAMQPVPPGACGEICIGGAGVGRGYLNRPTLTAKRFVPDPFASRPGARLYRTGDIGRFRGDGEIEFLGRDDDQIKLRGFRIEPGEIEHALRAHEQIDDAVVALRDDLPGGRGMAAYLVATGAAFGAEEMREFLRPLLPSHMIPVAFVWVPRIPLTAGGKVDRRGLPKPQPEAGDADDAALPSTDTEFLLTEIWEQVLGVKPAGVDANFFDLGGHSLLAVRLVSSIAARVSLQVPLRTVFERPTLRSLAEFVEKHEPDERQKSKSRIRKLPREPAGGPPRRRAAVDKS